MLLNRAQQEGRVADAFTSAEEPLLFDRLEDQPTDSLLQLIGLAKADPRPDKIDVGVGVYRDAAGGTPILRAVKAAERILLETQETKAYLGSAGDKRFVELIKPIVFGEAGARDERIVGVQTPGGLRRAPARRRPHRQSQSDARIFVGQPTWPNHGPLIECAGVEMVKVPYYDATSRHILFDEMMDAMDGARGGDLILLHGCCHNPTGAD
jgi:aromatic-amino-acid transaminase